MLALVAFGEHQGVAQRRFWSPIKVPRCRMTSVCLTFFIGKTMVFVCEHNVCIEIGMHGIGGHKNGLLAAMWLKW